jgi:hypothetical protein
MGLEGGVCAGRTLDGGVLLCAGVGGSVEKVDRAGV